MSNPELAAFPFVGYPPLMGETDAYLSIELDLSEPVEIGDFAALFAGLGGQFETYLAENQPDAAGTARLYVREVRRGSIIADLFAQAGPEVLGFMASTLTVLGFAALFNKRLRAWMQGREVEGLKKSELRDAADALRAVANAKAGKAALKSYRFVNGVFETKLEAEFTVPQARKAIETVEKQIRTLEEKQTSPDHTRQLMRFVSSDIKDAKAGKKSGEKAVIEKLLRRALPVIYASEIAGQEIKTEIRDADDNFYKKGFVVDLMIVQSRGRPVAYAITHLHQVIDLPDE